MLGHWDGLLDTLEYLATALGETTWRDAMLAGTKYGVTGTMVSGSGGQVVDVGTLGRTPGHT